MRRLAWVVSALALGGCLHTAGRPAEQSLAGAPAVIEGEDSRGRPLRLADHAGEVVLLSFWHGG
jgi:hypothetical protein